MDQWGIWRHTMGRKILIFLLAGWIAAVFPVLVWADVTSRAELEKVEAQRQQEEAEREIEALEKEQSEKAQESERLQSELVRLLTMEALLKTDLEDLKNQVEAADKAYNEAQSDQEHQYEIMKKRIRYIYEEGNVSYLDILLRAKSVGDLVNETEYAGQLYEYDRNMLVKYQEVQTEVKEKKEALENRRSELTAMQQEYEGQQAELVAALEKNRTEAGAYQTRLESARQKAEKAAAKVREKTEEIRRIKKQQELVREKQKKRQEILQKQREAEQRQNTAPAAEQKTEFRAKVRSTGGTAFGRSVADYALQFVGNPYVWGGTSLTNGADCSGFTQSVYSHFGVRIPRTSAEQAGFGREIPYEEMEPGDLVCYAGHVAMYIGDGRIVHAASKKSGIKIGDDPAYRPVVSIRRPWQ